MASQPFSFFNVYSCDSECQGLYGIWHSLSNTLLSLIYSLLIAENGVITVPTPTVLIQLCAKAEMA